MKKVLLLALLGFISLHVYSSGGGGAASDGGGGGGGGAADDQTQSSSVLSQEQIQDFEAWIFDYGFDDSDRNRNLSGRYNEAVSLFDTTGELRASDLFNFFAQEGLKKLGSFYYFRCNLNNSIGSPSVDNTAKAIDFWLNYLSYHRTITSEDAQALLNIALEKSTFSHLESVYYDASGVLNQRYKDPKDLKNAIEEVSFKLERVQEVLIEFNESWFETLYASSSTYSEYKSANFNFIVSCQKKLNIYFDVLKKFSERLNSLLEKLKYDALSRSEKLAIQAKAAAFLVAGTASAAVSSASNAASSAVSSVADAASSAASVASSVWNSLSRWGRQSPPAGSVNAVSSPAAAGSDAASTVDSPAAGSDGLVEVEVDDDADDE